MDIKNKLRRMVGLGTAPQDCLDWDLEERDQWLRMHGNNEDETAPVETLVEGDE